jgi:Asp/Glu/hydantoin racemase
MPEPGLPMKIWYQSFIDPKEQTAYFVDLKKALSDLADPGVTFDVHGIVPPDVELHRLTEFRCAVQVVRNAVAAQEQGYDAMAIGHFQDGGLYEARATVDIPVLALGEASMLYACTLGQKIALVTINPVFVPMHEEQITRYGLRERIVVVKAIMSDPSELVRAFTDQATFDQVLSRFRVQVQPLVDQGIEVVIPAGGLPALLFSRLKHFTVGNATVLDPIGVLCKMAEMAVKLRRLNGTQVSRAATFIKPGAKAIREFLES